MQWWRNGDHPDDGPPDREGNLVRYFRHPDYPGDTRCPLCSNTMHLHGWIDSGGKGVVVCPGDVILQGFAERGSEPSWIAIPPNSLADHLLLQKRAARKEHQLDAIWNLADEDNAGGRQILRENEYGWSTAYAAVVALRTQMVRANLRLNQYIGGQTLQLEGGREQLLSDAVQLWLLGGEDVDDPDRAVGLLERFQLIKSESGAVGFLCRRCPEVGFTGGIDTDVDPDTQKLVLDQEDLPLSDVVAQALRHEKECHS